TGERSPDRERFAALKTYREEARNVLVGQNVVNLGLGELVTGMAVEVLE
ncbi:MOSC domain-containing protein, partial [Pseudomonas syringae pv. tagetis]